MSAYPKLGLEKREQAIEDRNRNHKKGDVSNGESTPFSLQYIIIDAIFLYVRFYWTRSLCSGNTLLHKFHNF